MSKGAHFASFTRRAFLTATAAAALYPNGASASYAMGWVAPSAKVRMHSGSNTLWFATGGFTIRDNNGGDAIAIVANIGNGANLPGPVEQPVLDFLTGV